MATSRLELFIDEVHHLIRRQNPSWPSGSNVYRFDPRRTNNTNHPPAPFFDWTTDGGRWVDAVNQPGQGNDSSGSYYTDSQDVSVTLTAADFGELKSLQYALLTAIQRVSGGHAVGPPGVGDYVVEPPQGAQVTYFQAQQQLTVLTEAPINNRSIAVTILTASVGIYTTGSLSDEGAGAFWLNVTRTSGSL